MEYEFSELEQLVTVLISPDHLKENVPTAELFSEYATKRSSEIDQIKKRFIEAVLKEGDESRITTYIYQHQICLIRFADIIYKWLRTDEMQHPWHGGHAKEVLTFYQKVYNDIAGLLKYLETNFSKYFDIDEILTQGCHEEFTKHVNRNLAQIKEVFKTADVNPVLMDIASEPLENFQDASAKITYRKRDYIQELLAEISNLIECGVKITSEVFSDLLISMNFNHSRFFNYLIRQYDTSAKQLSDIRELLGFYLLKLKNLRQLAVRRNLAFDIFAPDIRDQAGNWLSEEIYFLERRLQLGIELKPIEAAKEKIHTSLPVSQLSLALKLLIDSGIIINHNYTDLTKLVAQNFKTDRIEKISEDSLRNKYYNVEKGTAEKMKTVMVDLLNLIRDCKVNCVKVLN